MDPTTPIDENLPEIVTDMTDETTTSPVTDEATQIELLNAEIAGLTRKLVEQTEITKKAQSDYIHMKFDFDSYMRRMDEQSKTMKFDTLIDVVKKFTPFIDSLRVSLSVIPDDHKEDPMVRGVQIVYDKFITTLGGMHIAPIVSVGTEPDHVYHIPVSSVPTDDETMKGKIIQEFEQGFVYQKDGIKKVVTPAKVVIGS